MTRRIAVFLVALALASPVQAFAQGGTPDLRAQIAKVGEAWQAAFNAGNADALTALYTADARLLPPSSEPVAGGAAIKAYFTAQMAGGPKFALTQAEVMGFGDFAFESGKWVATAADGKHLDHGSYVTLFRKVDGAWKLHRDTWNSSMAQ
jgi:uncharacterized protein (TIGR02246 family)